MKPNVTQRQRRPIEREYLATLNAAVPLDTWQAICKWAADDAKARDWLAKWMDSGSGIAIIDPAGGCESGADAAAMAESGIAAHDLRRSFGFRLDQPGELFKLQESMRHSNIETTRRFHVGRSQLSTQPPTTGPPEQVSTAQETTQALGNQELAFSTPLGE